MRRLGVAYCVREGNFASVRAGFLCLSLVTHRNAQTGCKLFLPPCRIDAYWYCVLLLYVCATMPASRPTHPPHTQIHRQYLYLDRARLRKTHGLSLYLYRPAPHGSVGAASTRALDHIPECSSMIGLPFRHPGTLLSNHAIYSSPCIHFLLT